ncbi:hypothetical protein [Ralstonia syzygii]
MEAALGEPEHEVQSSVHGACLPHERDEYVADQGSGPRDDIEQAARDIESGLLDTDLHDTQGLECVVRERHAAGNGDPDRELANRTADAIERNRQVPDGSVERYRRAQALKPRGMQLACVTETWLAMRQADGPGRTADPHRAQARRVPAASVSVLRSDPAGRACAGPVPLFFRACAARGVLHHRHGVVLSAHGAGPGAVHGGGDVLAWCSACMTPAMCWPEPGWGW